MDINKLTIGEAKEKFEDYKELAKIFGSFSENVEETKLLQRQFYGYFIVRTHSAGVFAGEIESKQGDEIVMRNARRLWYWKGAASLSQLAMEGTGNPSECKFPCEVNKVVLQGVIETLECTKKAEKSIKGVPEWRQ